MISPFKKYLDPLPVVGAVGGEGMVTIFGLVCPFDEYKWYKFSKLISKNLWLK